MDAEEIIEILEHERREERFNVLSQMSVEDRLLFQSYCQKMGNVVEDPLNNIPTIEELKAVEKYAEIKELRGDGE